MVAAEFPGVGLIRNDRNLGFSRANNQGLDVANGELILLLNSDAEAFPGAVQSLARSFDDPGVVAAGGRLEHPDGRLQESCAGALTLWAVFCEQLYLQKAFPRSRIFNSYLQSSRANGPMEIEQVMGACLMFRPVERFDERFFLYCEDTDLCKRLRAHGKILYIPEARFVHALGASSTDGRWLSIARYNRGKELYFRIHHGLVASVLCWVLNRLGALLRLVFWLLVLMGSGGSARARRQVEIFGKVLVAAGNNKP